MNTALLDRMRKQNRWLRGVCNVEEQALRMVLPVDLSQIDPELIECRTASEMALFNYWRVMLSSEPQGLSFHGGGRSTAIIVRDRTTGAFLGCLALNTPPPLRPIRKLFDWDANPESRLAHQHQILMLSRCLPIYEFGQMLGGKMLALLATSQELVRLFELRFSFQYVYMVICTLHGKGSQFNRLQQRGIELIDKDDQGRGCYVMELRKKGLEYMRDGTPYGKTRMFKLADQTSYWQQRWLVSRLESTHKSPLITPDPERYRLSSVFEEKCLTPRSLSLTETNDVED